MGDGVGAARQCRKNVLNKCHLVGWEPFRDDVGLLTWPAEARRRIRLPSPEETDQLCVNRVSLGMDAYASVESACGRRCLIALSVHTDLARNEPLSFRVHFEEVRHAESVDCKVADCALVVRAKPDLRALREGAVAHRRGKPHSIGPEIDHALTINTDHLCKTDWKRLV